MFANLGSANISKNVVATVAQTIVSGAVFFVLYRYLYDQLGVEQIGVWSLVLAATSVSRIGELGLSAGVVKFVAQALGQGDTQRAADVVQTVALTLSVSMAVVLSLAYPLMVVVLGYFLSEQAVPLALNILPYAVMSLWAMIVVSVFGGGLDGCMRMDLRALLMATSDAGLLGFAMLLVPRLGLEGAAIAQLIQSVALMIVLWLVLRKQLMTLPFVPRYWKLPLLKEMVRYGVSFQIITVMNMLFDPVVKALMSRFGGLESLGYYEMANRLILQGRAIIVEASRVMVPAIATLNGYSAAQATQLFVISYRMTFYVSVLFYGLLGICISTISVLWIGYHQATFVQFALLLSGGWFANTLIGPAYFSNLGSGMLRTNMVSHIIMGVCSIVVGIALGFKYGGRGVTIGAVFGLIAGSIFLLVTYIKQAELDWPTFIIPRDMINLLMVGVSTIFLANYGRDQQSSLAVVIGLATMLSSIYLLYGWSHPVRKLMMRRSSITQ